MVSLGVQFRFIDRLDNRFRPGEFAHNLEAVANEGANKQGKEHCPESDGAAKEPPDHQHRDFNAQAHSGHWPSSAKVDSGHHAVAWSGPQIGGEVQAATQSHEGNAQEHSTNAHNGVVWVGDHRTHDLQSSGDHNRVGNGAQAQLLSQGNPGEQDHHTDRKGGFANIKRRAAGDTLGQHGPRADPEIGYHQEGFTGAKEPQTQNEHRQRAWFPGPPAFGAPSGEWNTAAGTQKCWEKGHYFRNLSARPLSIRYLGGMRLRRIALVTTTLLVGATLVSGCGGSGDEGAQSETETVAADVPLGSQQLMIDQQITVLDQPLVYPKKGAAQVSSEITTLEPGQETGWQLHRIPVFVYVLSGTYTVEYEAGVTKEFPAGSSMMQALKTSYNGINKGEETVQLLTVYMGAEGKRNVVRQ